MAANPVSRARCRAPALRCGSACGATSRSCDARSTAIRWCIWTARASSQRPLAGAAGGRATTRRHSHANVHRGVHALSQAATAAYEGARERVRRFINARSAREIIFVRGTTEGINLVAQSLRRAPRSRPGDEILITALEHHANIVPWQMVCEQTGCTLRVAPIDRARRARCGGVPEAAAGPRTRLVAVAHVSNALGTVLPVERMIDAAHARGALVLVDGAQAVPHIARRRAGARLRLLRLLGPQAVRPDRHRRALRARGLLAAHAALAGRRRHDPDGVLREDHLQRAAVQVRGRHAQHLRRHRAWRRHGLSSRRWDCEAIAAHEQRAAGARHARARSAMPGIELDRHGGAQGSRGVLHHGGRAPARPRHHSRWRGHRGAHRPSLRHAGDGRSSACRPRRAPPSAVYNTDEDIDAAGRPALRSARARCSR